MRGRLGAARSGGCSACIDRIGTIGVLPQSLTPPARAAPSLVQELWVAFPDARAQAEGASPPAGAVHPEDSRDEAGRDHERQYTPG